MTISYKITMNSSSCMLKEFYIRRQQLEAVLLCTDIFFKKAHTAHLRPLIVNLFCETYSQKVDDIPGRRCSCHVQVTRDNSVQPVLLLLRRELPDPTGNIEVLAVNNDEHHQPILPINCPRAYFPGAVLALESGINLSLTA
jgi:hypothetical protein